jgi:hypothetical protein
MSKYVSVSSLAILAFFLPLDIHSQTNAPSAGCPIAFVRIRYPEYDNHWIMSARVRNTSAKKIVGIIFNAALADATESWTWIPGGSGIAEFDWNRELNPGQSKKLSWFLMNHYEHGGGGGIVPAKVLFADGSSWEDFPNLESCMGLWYNPHKKAFVKPIQLPPRQQ